MTTVQLARARCEDCAAPGQTVTIAPTTDPRQFTWRCARCGTSGTIAWATAAAPPQWRSNEPVQGVFAF